MAFIFSKKAAQKVLFVGSEAAPFVKAGGLGGVLFALPRALKKIGHDARVMIPRYAGVDLEKFRLQMEKEGLRVPTDASGENANEPAELICNVRKYVPNPSEKESDSLPVFTYFLENQEYYEKRSNVYGYTDDALRWALLSRGVLEFLRTSSWVPDVIVASDWQTGFLVNYLHTTYRDDPRLQKIASLFVIHNLYYQANFDHHYTPELDFDDGQSALPSFFDERLLKINGMRRGIIHADVISTVSPNYSREIMTKEYGEQLEELIKERRARVHGILNGIDYADFNPETDKQLAENYSSSSLVNRIRNKLELQARFNLKHDKDVPLLTIISRLTEQKGFELLIPVIEPLLKELKFQLVVIGTGDAKYMGFFKELAEKFPDQVAVHLNFDKVLPRLAYGGADMIIIPSKFEPSGLTQMEAMRYGVIPIVRKTGGLADSVKDFNPTTGRGNGFVFTHFDELSLVIAITRACENYRNRLIWKEIQLEAMMRDFSWHKSAQEYAHLFEAAIDFRQRELEE